MSHSSLCLVPTHFPAEAVPPRIGPSRIENWGTIVQTAGARSSPARLPARTSGGSVPRGPMPFAKTAPRP